VIPLLPVLSHLQLPEDRPALFTSARITHVEIARLHNLGNYEHIRYQVKVELPLGTSPASVVGELEQVLADLEPKCPWSTWDLAHAQKLLQQAEPDEGTTAEDHARRRDAARDKLARYAEWRLQRDAALAKLDQFGGLAVHTDAKDRWDGDN
jgi:hypothetical protein